MLKSRKLYMMPILYLFGFHSAQAETGEPSWMKTVRGNIDRCIAVADVPDSTPPVELMISWPFVTSEGYFGVQYQTKYRQELSPDQMNVYRSYRDAFQRCGDMKLPTEQRNSWGVFTVEASKQNMFLKMTQDGQHFERGIKVDPNVVMQRAAQPQTLENADPNSRAALDAYYLLYLIGRHCAEMNDSFTLEEVEKLKGQLSKFVANSPIPQAERDAIWTMKSQEVTSTIPVLDQDACRVAKTAGMQALPNVLGAGNKEANPF